MSKVKPNNNRLLVYGFMRSSLLKYPFKPSIPAWYFSKCVSNIKENDYFEELNENVLNEKKNSGFLMIHN